MVYNKDKLFFTIKRHMCSYLPYIVDISGFDWNYNEFEDYVVHTIKIYTELFGRKEINYDIIYCLKELLVNADRANSKRIYFKLKNLNLENEEEYKKGMKNFKKDFQDKYNFYRKRQKDDNYWIKVVFHTYKNNFFIFIINNAPMTNNEFARITKRINEARNFNSNSDIYNSLDMSEGAGFGIIIVMLMIKKMGFKNDSFNINIKDNKTIARVTLPISKNFDNHINEILNIISNSNYLDYFNNNLKNMIDKKEISKNTLYEDLITNPFFSFNKILLNKDVDSIIEYYNTIDLNEMNIFTDQSNNYYVDFLKNNAKIVKILFKYVLKINDTDRIYKMMSYSVLSGLSLLILNFNKDYFYNKIKNETNININLLDLIFNGYAYEYITAKLLEKLNFPSALLKAVNSFKAYRKNNLDLNIMYLAYLINKINNEELYVSDLEDKNKFSLILNISDKESIDNLLNSIKDILN